jgi:DNA (cytosine-5)-methyltransferase 1
MTKSQQKHKYSDQLNFIDVFAGAGGLSCGLELAGHRCLLGIDYDKHAMDTFALNHEHAQTYCGDVRKLTNKKIEELTSALPIHAVVGGPPCQGFSTAGAGNPEDARNSLFLEFVRIVRVTKPAFVVMENVTGLMAKKNEETLYHILKKFASLGYHMDVKVLSAHHYGVAEKRRRTIFIGTRINEQAIFPSFTHEDLAPNGLNPTATVGDVLKKLGRRKNIPNHDLEAAALKHKIDEKRLARIPEGKGIRYQKDEDTFLTPSLKLGVDWDNLKENRFRQCKYQRLDRKKPGPTIMTNRHSYYHPTKNRYLTAREAALIQSFPMSFIFSGPLSAQWRQIGNAVPPLLGYAIGISLKEMIKMANKKVMQPTKRKKPSRNLIENLRGKAFVYKVAEQASN